MEFKEYKIYEISKKVFSGGTPNTKEPNFWGGNLKWLSSGETRNGFIHDTEKKITEKGAAESSTRLAKKHSIVIASAGQGFTRGQVSYLMNDMYINQSLICIDCKETIVNSLYLYYLLKSQYKKLRNISDGNSSRGSLTTIHIKNYSVELPSIENQNKIVKILSDIDKKIEVNNKISDNLQKISKELYKKWFIDFDFPNENGKPYKSSGGEMIESELGGIPKGWKISNFDDDILTKIIKSGVDSYPGEKRYVATADVNGTKINNFSKLKYNEKPSRANMPPIKNSVWFAKMKGSVKNILVEEFMEEIIDNYIFSTGFLGMECLNKSTSYIWSIINDDKFISDKDNLSTGTLMAGINNETIKKYKYLIPVVRVLEKYNETIENINREIYSLNSENSQLTNLRDTLLPKLLNGEIDLEQIEV